MNTYAVLLMGDQYQELLADVARPNRHSTPRGRTVGDRIRSMAAGLRSSLANGSDASASGLPKLKDYPYRG